MDALSILSPMNVLFELSFRWLEPGGIVTTPEVAMYSTKWAVRHAGAASPVTAVTRLEEDQGEGTGTG